MIKKPFFLLIFHKCRTLWHLCSKSSFSTRIKESFSQVYTLPELNNEVKFRIESKWLAEVSQGSFDVNNDRSPKKYVLSMFPYPSGNLHMGHVRVYTIGDAMARFYRLKGKNVLHPIGFDAFGLPAENAAFERKIPADKWTWSNISTMRAQLKKIGFSFDWDRELITCSPSYYKFTQYLFLLLYKNGLVYSREDIVNWDPVDKTVLANEQVDGEGRSWRSGAIVEKKLLKQWFIETTRFAEQLLKGLDNPILDDWKDIKNIQSHWIGNCNGSLFKLKAASKDHTFENISVWFRYPELLKDCCFIVARKDSFLNLKYGPIPEGLLGLTLVNPINQKLLPVYITNDANYDEGCDVKLVVPSVDTELCSLAKKLNVSWEEKEFAEDIFERRKVCDLARNGGIGGYLVSSKLKDWPISRQRKWGTPIPLINCSNCGTIAVDDNELPVELPSDETFNNWINIECPKCGNASKRVSDTMDTFVDSAWYFLRYLDPTNVNLPYSLKLSDQYMPVDLYIGGKEHAVLHLYYARFFCHFLNSIGLLKVEEPFKRLLVQGMVLGKTYQLKDSGKYLPHHKISKIGGVLKDTTTGKEVIESWEKMSKSKYNGIEPNAVLDKYGIDTTRLFILSDVAPTSNKFWNDDKFPGILKWQKRIWALMNDFISSRKNPIAFMGNLNQVDEDMRDTRNYYTMGISFNFGESHQLSVAISKMQGMTNSLKKCPKPAMGVSSEFEKALCALIIMMSPVCPSFSSELWSFMQAAPSRVNIKCGSIRWDLPVLSQSWPRLDLNYPLPLNFAVNNAIKDTIKMPCSDFHNITSESTLAIALNNKKIKDFILDCDILDTKLTIFPDYEATLNIIVSHEQRVAQKKLRSESK